MSEQKRPEICEYCALGDHDAYICARWRLSYAVNELKKAVPLLRRTAEKQMKCPYYYPAGLLKTGLVIMDEIGPWPPERKPEWWEKILAGEKDLEIRKTAPRAGAGGPEPWPLLVLAYVSGTGAVLGQFLCMGWVKSNCFRYLASRSCVPAEDLEKYAGGKSLYGWIVGEAEEYETPSPLAEFGLTRPPMSWQYIEIPDDKEE